MASLYIQEYAHSIDAQRRAPVGSEPAIVSQKITFTTTTASAGFSATAFVVRLISDVDVWLSFGATPTATATSLYLPGNTVEYFGVVPGQKVAAYDGFS